MASRLFGGDGSGGSNDGGDGRWRGVSLLVVDSGGGNGGDDDDDDDDDTWSGLNVGVMSAGAEAAAAAWSDVVGPLPSSSDRRIIASFLE